jgi:hypothetical protein
VRLKLERNAVQDIALLASLAKDSESRDRVAQAFNGTSPAEWWTPRPALANTNPQDWSNAEVCRATGFSRLAAGA